MTHSGSARTAARSPAASSSSSSSAPAAPAVRRTAPPRRLQAAIALVALIGAGCSNAPETGGGGVENPAGDGHPATGGSPNPEREGKLSEFATCMRENGVEDFPDPDEDGIIQFHGGTDTPEFESARENCRVVLPGGLGASQGAPGGGG